VGGLPQDQQLNNQQRLHQHAVKHLSSNHPLLWHLLYAGCSWHEHVRQHPTLWWHGCGMRDKRYCCANLLYLTCMLPLLSYASAWCALGSRMLQVCKYIDMPLQHINNLTLLAMNRPPQAHTKALLHKLRDNIPGLALRTTFISGAEQAAAQGRACYARSDSCDRRIYAAAMQGGTCLVQLLHNWQSR
jgi:hypothetical protein